MAAEDYGVNVSGPVSTEPAGSGFDFSGLFAALGSIGTAAFNFGSSYVNAQNGNTQGQGYTYQNPFGTVPNNGGGGSGSQQQQGSNNTILYIALGLLFLFLLGIGAFLLLRK